MIPVTIEYRPLPFIPHTRHLETMLPARWSELTTDQFMSVPDLLRDKLDETKQISIFLHVSAKIASRMDNYQKYCILRNLKYVAKPEALDSFYIPEICGLKAPGPKLYGVTWAAFIFGDTYFQNYQNGDKKALDKFIACYYLPESGFNSNLIESNATLIRNTPNLLREAVAINYGLIRNWLAKSYPWCFEKNEEGKKPSRQAGWVEVHDRLVGADIANGDRYLALPVSTVLRFLNTTLKDYHRNGSQIQRPGRVFRKSGR